MGCLGSFHAHLCLGIHGTLHIFYHLEMAIAKFTIRAFLEQVAKPSVGEDSYISTSQYSCIIECHIINRCPVE